MLMLFVIFHIRESMETDERSHDGNDQDHNEREMVTIDILPGRRPFDHEELKPGGQEDLKRGESLNEKASMPESQIKDRKHQSEIRDPDDAVKAKAENTLRRKSEGGVGDEKKGARDKGQSGSENKERPKYA
jgi:hypothetical protein